MKGVVIANDLYLHIRSKPRHLLLTHANTHVTKATKDLHFNLFQVKRDTIKSNLSSARLPMSIYWLTTFGISVYPFKTCRVTVKGKSIVLLTYSSLDGKIGHTSKCKCPYVKLSTSQVYLGQKCTV